MHNTKVLKPLEVQSVADMVFEQLLEQILSLQLPPGVKVSEAQVIEALGVSRQPVRDAFFRLAQCGLLVIKPQRATVVTKISRAVVKEAVFIRTALEIACWSTAARRYAEDQFRDVGILLDKQKSAIDAREPTLFHKLDDELHGHVCHLARHEYVWNLIKEHKFHMDRVRSISSANSFCEEDLEDHLNLNEAMKSQNYAMLEDLLRQHFKRIEAELEKVVEVTPEYFLN